MAEQQQPAQQPAQHEERTGSQPPFTRRAMLSSIGMAGAALAVGSALGGATSTVFGTANTVTHHVYGSGPEGADGWACCLSVTKEQLRNWPAPETDRIYYMTDDKQGGAFVYDPADTTSPDNEGTVIVSASGARFKRQLDGPLNVRWFGAKGDGIHDDGPAIQRAIDAGRGGARVYFPLGTYRITASLVVPYPEVTFLSDFKSEYNPRILCTTPDTWMIRSTHYSFCMRGLQLEGDGDLNRSPYAPTVNGILFDRSDGTGAETLANIDADIQFCGFFKMNECVRCVGRNVFFNYNLFSASIRAVTVDEYPRSDCRGYRFVQNRFHSIGLDARPITPGASSWCIAFTSIRAHGNQIIGNMADFCKGFYIGPVDRCSINDNQVYNISGDGIRIVNSGGGTTLAQQGYEISGNIMTALLNLAWDKSASDTYAQMEYGIVCETPLLDNGVIQNNVIAFPKKDGIFVEHLYASLIQNNSILSPNKRADVDGSHYAGIRVNSGSYNMIAGNMVRTTKPNNAAHKHGIYNGASESRLLHNFGFHQSDAFIVNLVPQTTDVVEAGIPRYSETYKRNIAAETFGIQMYTQNGAKEKVLFGEVVAMQQSSTVGAEKADLQFNAMANGTFSPLMKASWQGALTVGDRAGKEVKQNGYVNAKALHGEFLSFVPSAAASVPNGSLFMDAADGKLKCKDGSGVIVSLT